MTGGLGLFALMLAALSTAAEGTAIVEQVGTPKLMLHVAQGAVQTQTAWLTVEDVKGDYTIPYIQTNRTLHLMFTFDVAGVVSVRVRCHAEADPRKTPSVLSRNDAALPDRLATPPDFSVSFAGLQPAEYTVRIRAFDTDDTLLREASCERIGVGTIAAALGDSITEGYFGRGFLQSGLYLRAEQFPENAVSRDGRNFPQYAPTTHDHLPSVNCFESWMTQLNDGLSKSWHEPVFIANEGWGGITSGGYLEMIRNDGNWRCRMEQLRPQLWLIHLGVNDERAHVSTQGFAANIAAIVDLIVKDFGATPRGIFIANPCYDYFEGASAILAQYCDEIDRLVLARGLQHGPDFFKVYATDQERWYGEDPVHPNVDGMNRMAEAWREALVTALPNGPG